MEDDGLEFTAADARDEIAAAMADMARPVEPMQSDGWRTITQITEASSEGIPVETMRKRVDRQVEIGKFEKMVIGSRCYYRIKRDA